MERKYTLENIRDYILYHYGAKWKDYKVYDHFEERDLLPSDFLEEDFLSIIAVLEKGDEVLYCCLYVSNERLSLGTVKPIIDVFHSRKKWWTWKDFLSEKPNLQKLINDVAQKTVNKAANKAMSIETKNHHPKFAPNSQSVRSRKSIEDDFEFIM